MKPSDRNIQRMKKEAASPRTPPGKAAEIHLQLARMLEQSDPRQAADMYYMAAARLVDAGNYPRAAECYLKAGERYMDCKNKSASITSLDHSRSIYLMIQWNDKAQEVEVMLQTVQTGGHPAEVASSFVDREMRRALEQAEEEGVDVEELRPRIEDINRPNIEWTLRDRLRSSLMMDLKRMVLEHRARRERFEQSLRQLMAEYDRASSLPIHKGISTMDSILQKAKEVRGDLASKGQTEHLGRMDDLISTIYSVLTKNRIKVRFDEVKRTADKVTASIDNNEDEDHEADLRTQRASLKGIQEALKAVMASLAATDVEHMEGRLNELDERLRELLKRNEEARRLRALKKRKPPAAVAKARTTKAAATTAPEPEEFLFEFDGNYSTSRTRNNVFFGYAYSLEGMAVFNFKVSNKSGSMVTDLRIMMDFEETIIRVVDVKPERFKLGKDGTTIHIGNLGPDKEFEITVVGDIMSYGVSDIEFRLMGKDARNEDITAKSDSEVENIRPPDLRSIIKEKDVNTALLKAMMAEAMPKRDAVQWSVPEDIGFNRVFMEVVNIIQSRAKLIRRKNVIMEPYFYGDIWFGSMGDPSTRYLVNVELDGREHRLRIDFGGGESFSIDAFKDQILDEAKARLEEGLYKGRTLEITNVTVDAKDSVILGGIHGGKKK